MAYTTESTGSPVKSVTVILAEPQDWEDWIFLVKRKADANGLWQYVDPSLDNQPELLKEPKFPQPSSLTPPAQDFNTLTDEQDKSFQRLERVYRLENKRYQDFRRRIDALDTHIVHTVSRENLAFVRRDCDTTYLALKALKRQLAPTDKAREIEIANKYNALKEGPRNQDVDKWLANWEIIYQEASTLKLPEVSDNRSLFDFLNAVKGLNETFSTTKMTQLLESKKEDLPTLPALIKSFRDLRRLSKADRGWKDTHSAFTALQGQPDHRPVCVCGKNHSYSRCYYLIERIRPENWTPDPHIQQSISEQLASNARLAGHIENIKKASKPHLGSF